MVIKGEPNITVGILDNRLQIAGNFKGNFYNDYYGSISGKFSAKIVEGKILFTYGNNRHISSSREIKFTGGHKATFQLFDVTVGSSFHWERKETQIFKGNMILKIRREGTIAVINEIPLEDYLISVISSEMNSSAPEEFLKTHAIVSRSWLLASLLEKNKKHTLSKSMEIISNKEIVRWYGREDHDLFDVCANDHCQRYHGLTKKISYKAQKAVQETRGLVAMYRNKICDTRYSKACGGLTEDFKTAWANKRIPYLTGISDGPVQHSPIKTEKDTINWIQSKPHAYCNVHNKNLLKKILPDSDRKTQNFFRWKVTYTREELENILKKKSGLDFGKLKHITPLQRGFSGRIFRLRIAGSKKSIVIGKELEIRRCLSPTHLLSSAFFITAKKDHRGEAKSFTFNGAGWGHGVGLCQIGAAVMAYRGFSADKILKHYFKGIKIQKIY